MIRKATLLAILALAAAQAQAAPTASALAAGTGYAISADAQVENMCGEKVEARVIEVELGGAVGTAQLLLIPGGPNTLTCYGDVPGDMYLFVADGDGFRQVFSGGGYIQVLKSDHDGVHDFALGGPGFSFPLYVWDGKGFAMAGEISDQDVSARLVASYPE